MNKPFVFIVISLLFFPSLYAAISPSFYHSEVHWKSYEQAKALDTNKPIFVFAKMRFCTTCAAMETKVFTEPKLAKLLNEQFIPVKETTNFMLSRFVFDDLKDDEGNVLSFNGFPAVMVVNGNQYSLSYGFKSADQLIEALTNTASN